MHIREMKEKGEKRKEGIGKDLGISLHVYKLKEKSGKRKKLIAEFIYIRVARN